MLLYHGRDTEAFNPTAHYVETYRNSSKALDNGTSYVLNSSNFNTDHDLQFRRCLSVRVCIPI
jgi:hypothetical protein